MQQFMAHTVDYSQVKYRPIIFNYSEIIQYIYFLISLWHTESINFMIYAWPMLQRNIQRNDDL